MTRIPTWRDHAKPIIERVLKETQGMPENEIKRALRDAYPFGEREYHPYKIWLDEIKRQRGFKKTKHNKTKDNTFHNNQKELF